MKDFIAAGRFEEISDTDFGLRFKNDHKSTMLLASDFKFCQKMPVSPGF